MKTVKAAIVGSRSFNDYEKMYSFIQQIRKEKELFIRGDFWRRGRCR